MKSFLIAVGLCATLIGCASSSDEPKETKEYVNDYQPNYLGGGGSYYNPCGKTYHLKFPLSDGGTMTKDVPVYCNPNADEYYPDPPDWKSNPWDLHTLPELDRYNQDRP